MTWSKCVIAFALAAAVGLFVTACGDSPRLGTHKPAVSGDPAAALVSRFQMGNGLESLALAAARRTVTYSTLVQRHGSAGADMRVKSELAKSIQTYQPRWDANLSEIYSLHFSPEELRSLAEQGPQSPHAGKFASTREAVGAEMRAASIGLLEQVVTEALSRAAKSP